MLTDVEFRTTLVKGKTNRKTSRPFGERQDRRSLRCSSSTIDSVGIASSSRLDLDDPDAPSLVEKPPNPN